MENRTPDPTLPPQVLATLLALAADGDPTEPTAWRSVDVLRSLEEQVVQGQRAFEYWAAVCAQAAKQCTSPTAAALFERNAFNARRRVPDADWGVVLTVGQQVEQTIHALPICHRSLWLLGMHAYDMGVLCRDGERFDDAAHYQETAAEQFRALGDIPSAMISSFLVAVETMNAVLHQGHDHARALERLDAAYLSVAEVLPGHGWWPNVPLHLLLAHAWANDLGYAAFDKYAAFFLAAGTNARLAHWSRLVTAMKLIRERQLEPALFALDAVIARAEEDRNGDVTMTARLLKARLFPMTYMPDAARDEYQAIALWTGLKGRVVMAIAKRELAALPIAV